MATQTHVTEKTNTGSPAEQASRAASRAEGGESGFRPPVDIFEKADSITLRADMPGVSKDNLNVQVEGNTLLVEGRLQIDTPESMEALYADVRSTLYRCSFVLSPELESSRIEANLRDGVLTVRIPKRAELQPRRIQVQAG